MRSLLAVLLALALPATAQAGELVEIEIPARNGEVTDEWLKYPGPPRARVLLPDGYDAQRRYPLLVLLGGLDNTYKTWSEPTQGNVPELAAGLQAIVVMPEGGNGWYVDWWSGGKRGEPAWESYILDQVLPQVRERYRIRRQRRYHALAGASMGGLGAAYLGGRLPGYFGSVAVLSGLVDTQALPAQGGVMSLLATAPSGQLPSDPQVVMGPEGGFYANGHNPVRLAPNLAQTRVFMTTGDGTAAPDSTTGPNAQADAAKEMLIRQTSDNLAAALGAAGVDLTYDVHPGYHDWPNFHGEVRAMLGWGLFKPVDERPTSWVDDTVATHGHLWRFAYRFDAPPDRVVRFRRAGGRLSISAAGSPVTITHRGCVLHRDTPATVRIPRRACR